jgi:iron complex outermembrane receptor protein
MDEVVVTATRDDQRVATIPANVTVITRDDIEKSTANTIVDVLATEGNLVTSSTLGNDKNARIDIRGMGETSVSSVLVLVDGIRINPSDMAGPDFTTLSLNQVERIEILRGAGSVLYGDGAVGGVVNIISRPAGGDPGAGVKAAVGSYDTYNAFAEARGSLNVFHLAVDGNVGDTDGYRENGDFSKKNFNLNAAADASDYLTLNAGFRYHKDEYGFPGPLTLEQFEQDPRQSLDNTGSKGNTEENAKYLGFENDFLDYGVLTARFTSRDRDNDWVLLGTPGLIEELSRDLNVKHKWDRSFMRADNELTVGVDFRNAEYFQEASFAIKRFDVDQLGLYALDRITLFDRWTLQGGARFYDYENEDQDSGDSTRWDGWVYNAGLLHQLPTEWTVSGSLFASFATSFRIPDIDELGFSTGDLVPQTGKHVDVGAKLKFSDTIQTDVTYFYIRLEDELFFDALNFINTNFDSPTERTGVEVAVRWFPISRVRLWANYTYTRARFEDIDFKVPLVPENKFSAGVNAGLFAGLEAGISYNYVGERPQGGTPTANSTYDEIPSYQTVDLKVSGALPGLPLTAAFTVNNLFDEQYYATAFYDSVYPSPGVNYLFELAYRYE